MFGFGDDDEGSVQARLVVLAGEAKTAEREYLGTERRHVSGPVSVF